MVSIGRAKFIGFDGHLEKVVGEDLRSLTWIASSGDYGVTEPQSLKVVATSPPSNQVTVTAGGAILFNPVQKANGRAPYDTANPGQSYLAKVPTPVNVSIPPNTSASQPAAWKIVAFVEDPQYVTVSWSELVVTVMPATAYPTNPYLELAQITLPPNTGTVTDAMIVERRKLLLPRVEEQMQYTVFNAQGVLSGSDGTPASSMSWPPYNPLFQVPEWATKVAIEVEVSNIFVNGGTLFNPDNSSQAKFSFRSAIQFGGTAKTTPSTTSTGTVGPSMPVVVAAIARYNWVPSVRFYRVFDVPPSYRGTAQQIGLLSHPVENPGAGFQVSQNQTLQTTKARFFETL